MDKKENMQNRINVQFLVTDHFSAHFFYHNSYHKANFKEKCNYDYLIGKGYSHDIQYQRKLIPLAVLLKTISLFAGCRGTTVNTYCELVITEEWFHCICLELDIAHSTNGKKPPRSCYFP